MGTEQTIKYAIVSLLRAGLRLEKITAERVIEISGYSKGTVVRSKPWDDLMIQRAGSRGATVELFDDKSRGTPPMNVDEEC